jgi:hypothetical protein
MVPKSTLKLLVNSACLYHNNEIPIDKEKPEITFLGISKS